MTITDKAATDALVKLLEQMRQSGRNQGRIEVMVNNGVVQEMRVIKISESVMLKAS